MLTDRQHLSINSSDNDISSAAIFDIYQQAPATPIDQLNTNHTDTKPPTAPPLGATFSQFSVFRQSRTTRRLRQLPVKIYRTHVPASRSCFHSGLIQLKST